MKSRIVGASASLALSCLASQVFAAGFQLQEQNVTNLGLAYSGTGALAEDASIGYYNSAGLTRINDSQIVLSGVLIQGSFDLDASSSTTSFGAPMGSGSTSAGTVSAIPTFHLAKRIDDRWVFGFNVTVPFGLATRYDDDSIARYLATESEIATVNIGPSLAYQILPCLSLGGGVDAEYLRAILSAKFGPGITEFEGYQRNHAEGWGYGWHVGVMWEPLETTRVGLSYRSKMNVALEGDSENQTPLGYSLAKVNSWVVLPETATLSLYHELNDQYAITADVAWTDWSRFGVLHLRYDRPLNLSVQNPFNVNVPIIACDTDTFENYKDSRRYALGLIYTHDARWLFRVGASFDETPVRDDFRTARLPDEDRYWLALGGAYTINKQMRVDFGYAHLFFNNASINEHAPVVAYTDTPVSAATLTGDYDNSANLLGIQFRYDFD